MNLHRWLQLQTAGLAILGASFLLLSGDQSIPPLLLGGSAIVALLVTDFLGWVKLPKALGNLAAVAAVAWSLRDFLVQSRENQLLTISHMLIYLQVVLIFQAKSRRVYWQLLVLSVLQVVVAAALSLGPTFGLLLVVYMANAIGCMILLSVQKDVADDTVTEASTPKSPQSLHRLLDVPSQRLESADQHQLDHWVRAAWLTRSVVMFTGACVLFALAFFFLAPRLSDATWQSTRGRSAVSGFNGEVVLRSRGSIKLSDQPVMRVSFQREDNRSPVPLVTEPYFHGQVLTNYVIDEYGARWIFQPSYRLMRGSTRVHHNEARRPGDLVRQEYVLEVTQSPVLFSLMPVQLLPDTPHGIREHRQSPRLTRFGNEEQLNLTREYRYAIGTLAIRNGRQVHAVPHFNPAELPHEKLYLASEREDLSRFSVDRFPGIKQVADDVIRRTKTEHASTLMKAIELRNHLFSSGDFEYSLDLNDGPEAQISEAVGESRVDPLEHFVVQRRRGHCEYFASALVMMLRSQNIPCRLVIGYKGGDWNALGGYYLVRQKHAHAWVEVLLPPNEVPAEEIAGTPSGGGAWYRLDPTPAATSDSDVATNDAFSGQVSDMLDYADYLWRDYVLGLNSGRQDSVLDPINARTRELLPRSIDPQRLQKWARSMINGKQQDAAAVAAAPASHLTEATSEKFPWLRVLAWTVVVVSVPVALALFTMLAHRLVQRWFQRPSHRSGNSVSSTFSSVERCFRRLGVRVPPEATAEELLRLAASTCSLHRNGSSAGVEARLGILQSIVRRYHRLRFSSQPLVDDEQQLRTELAALLSAEHQPQTSE